MHEPGLWPVHEGLPAAVPIGAAGRGGDRITVDDPATRQTIGWCEVSVAEDIDRAVSSAEESLAAWAADPARREACILAGAAAIAAHHDALAAMIVREVGKARFEADGDVGGGVHLLRAFAALSGRAAETEDLTGRDGAGAADEVLVHRAPVGPVAVVTPWNTPVYLTMNCVGPALAAGCTVVVKPAEQAPLAVTAALRLLSEQLPVGVLQVVQGTGTETGAQLTAHPRVRGVLFVGGIRAGRQVLAAAAPTIKKVSLELGGNDPALVLDDAVLDDAAVRELVAGSLSLSGQVCFNIKRIYVHRSRHDELIEKLCAAIDRVVVGPGNVPGVQMGPLTTEQGYLNARRLRDDVVRAGARIHTGGVLAPGVDADAGRFVRPAIVSEIARDHEVVMTEQFAPLLPVIPFDSDDEAVAEANRTEYGLCSSVWSADPAHARRVARRVEAGNTFINAHRVGASVPLVPFGGVKQSGLGRNHLMHAVAECMEEHAIVRYSDPSEQIRGIDPWRSLTSSDRVPA